MRIGTNHGSLSDRILSRYGDTPLGMVESAFEFLKICEEANYADIVLSMKASNTRIMVQAYRLLVHKMIESGRDYPLHLGVTEAGEGEDGRIKSAVGIGTLLEDGLGDTIRVSLTEDPEFEIPVAKNLAERYEKRAGHKTIPPLSLTIQDTGFSPFEYKRHETNSIVNIGGNNVPRVIADFSDRQKVSSAAFFSAGYTYSIPMDKWNLSDQACDYVFLGDNEIDFEIPGTLGLIYNFQKWKGLKNRTRSYPLFHGSEYFMAKNSSALTGMTSDELNFILVDIDLLMHAGFRRQDLDKSVVFIFDTTNNHGMAEQRRMFFELMGYGSNPSMYEGICRIPVIIKRNYTNLSEEKFQLHSSTDIGGLLLDGFGDGIWISQKNGVSPKIINSTSFGLLQATRARISKTEYISCPSCGRTLFDLQETTGKIRSRTSHLKGLKIGIMGCIVNGPGEMADADYGYVGTGIGKITLYKGKEVIKKNIPAEAALDELIGLIKANGDWIENT
jgi:(E)-4-hydroxy-3-methylbut-2-enyl-diphosphate synthase